MHKLNAQPMKTALNARHHALGAKMVDFCGWEMPVQYQGIIPEHVSVRTNAGLFDVSHMGRVAISGRDAERFLDYLSTNSIAGKKDFSATYTVWPNAVGGCVDDVIVYRQSPQHFFVIVNACNRQSDLEHLLLEAKAYDVQVQDCYADEGIISIQGPKACAIASLVFPEASELKHMHFCCVAYRGQPAFLSRTGYTGEDGFEVYAPHAVIIALWDRWLAEGQTYGIAPVGLGARDTLRLEKGYALYGHEISASIAPSESVSAWTIKWSKADFLAKPILQRLEDSPLKRSAHGVVLVEPGVARAGYEVFKDGQLIGEVTSGTQSPTLNRAIALVLVQGTLLWGDIVEIQIRQRRCQAKVVKIGVWA
jgi:aminomethyltransferase